MRRQAGHLVNETVEVVAETANVEFACPKVSSVFTVVVMTMVMMVLAVISMFLVVQQQIAMVFMRFRLGMLIMVAVMIAAMPATTIVMMPAVMLAMMSAVMLAVMSAMMIGLMMPTMMPVATITMVLAVMLLMVTAMTFMTEPSRGRRRKHLLAFLRDLVTMIPDAPPEIVMALRIRTEALGVTSAFECRTGIHSGSTSGR